jgi:hypothetical protein
MRMQRSLERVNLNYYGEYVVEEDIMREAVTWLRGMRLDESEWRSTRT